MSAVLGAAWAALVVVAAREHRPPPARARSLAAAPSRTPSLQRPVVPFARRRAVAKASARALVEGLPETIDLLGVATAAGLNPMLAIAAVAERAPAPLAAELARVAAATARGRGLVDALDDMGRAHAALRRLAAALTDGARYGTPLGPSLERLADDARAARRRRAETAARRVPVLLLLPLVTCVLPAFGLLTIGPLLAGAARSLHL